MLKRTTHYQFQPYGEVFYELPDLSEAAFDGTYQGESIPLKNKTVTHVSVSTDPVYIDCKSGIVLLVVQKGDQPDASYEQFVVHRIVKLDRNVRYGLISISVNAEAMVYSIPQHCQKVRLPEPITFEPIETRLHIEEILATYYQVRKGDYVFPGEAHKYYELIYIDHGSMETSVEGKEFHLEKYDLMVYAPGQFHCHHTGPDQNCSYLTVIYRMNDALPEALENRIFHSRKDIYQVLCRFMKAIQSNDYLSNELSILYLKEVMILLHQFDHKHAIDANVNPMQVHYEHTLLNEILVYINNNIYSAFTVEDLCSKFSVSRSSLQNLFRSNLQISPKQYISEKKLSQAKQLIQEHKHTISEISDMLGFTSIHYFSRKFKAQYGVSPTDYSKSINQ